MAKQFIPTGSDEINSVLGLLGIPESVITTIIGNPDSAKTSIAIHLGAECQKLGGQVTVFDMENSYDETWMEKIGFDHTKADIHTPDELDDKNRPKWCVESIFQEITAICKRRQKKHDRPYLVVWDTFSQTPTARQLDDQFDTLPAEHARLVSEALRTLVGDLSRGRVTLVVVLQPKDNMATGKFKSIRYLAYRPWYHASIVQLDLSRIESLKTGDRITGSRIKVYTRKNKKAMPFQETVFDISGDRGIDSGRVERQTALDLAIAKGLVEKEGRKFKYKDTVFGKGEWPAVMEANEELKDLGKENNDEPS